MVNLYLGLPTWCSQKIHKSKGHRQCKIEEKEYVCLMLLCIFCLHRAGRGINAPLHVKKRVLNYGKYFRLFQTLLFKNSLMSFSY